MVLHTVKNFKGRDIMSTPYQIKKIHTLKNILGLDDDTYIQMLQSFDVCSSKNLTQAEAQIFIEILENDAKVIQKNVYKKYDEFADRDDKMATPSQLRKLEAVWADISNAADKSVTLRQFIKRQFHVDDLRFLTKARASQIIAILEKIKLQMCLKAF